MEMRLQRFLAQAGVASRRKAEEMISAGRVKVNGRVESELGVKIDAGRDKVEVDGKRVMAEPHAYIVLCKPRGYVTTVSDPEGRPTVMELIRRERGEAHRFYPVGRLDFHTDGVLLLTNDGDLAHALMHPSHGVPKIYHAKLRGVASDESLDELRAGVTLDDGVATEPADVVRLLQTDEGGHTWVQITIRQGLNRQIHRMGDAIGFPVLKLSRVAYGPITTEGLRPGEWRELEEKEIESLRKIARGETIDQATPSDDDEPLAGQPRKKPSPRHEVRGEIIRKDTPRRDQRKSANPSSSRREPRVSGGHSTPRRDPRGPSRSSEPRDSAAPPARFDNKRDAQGKREQRGVVRPFSPRFEKKAPAPASREHAAPAPREGKKSFDAPRHDPADTARPSAPFEKKSFARPSAPRFDKRAGAPHEGKKELSRPSAPRFEKKEFARPSAPRGDKKDFSRPSAPRFEKRDSDPREDKTKFARPSAPRGDKKEFTRPSAPRFEKRDGERSSPPRFDKSKSSAPRFDKRDSPRPSGGARFDKRDSPRPSGGARFDKRDSPRPSGGPRFEKREPARTGGPRGPGSAPPRRGGPRPSGGPRGRAR